MASVDIAGNISTTAVLEVGQSVTSLFELNHGDTDFFRVDLVAGLTYEFLLTDDYDQPDPSIPSSFISLYDSRGRRITQPFQYDYRNAAHTLQISAPVLGTYYVAASSGQTLDGSQYSIALQTISADYIESLLGTPTYDFRQMKLESGYGRTDALEELGDRDRFQVVMQAGRQYRIQVLGSDTDSGTLLDPDMTLYMDGQILKDYNGGYGHNSELVVTASSSGYFDLIVEGYGGTGTYQVISTEVDDYGNGYATQKMLSGLTGQLSGTIGGPTDIDWFRIDMVGGRWYDFAIDSPAYRGLSTPFLLLRDPGGNIVNFGYPTSPDVRSAGLSHFAQITGTYWLIARSSDPANSGDYRLNYSQAKRQLARGYQSAEAEALGIPDFELLTDYNPFINTGYGTPISLTQFVGTPLNGLVAYEVVTQNKLFRLGVEQATGQRHFIPANELEFWDLHMKPGMAQLQIRGVLEIGKRTSHTQWMVTTTRNWTWNDSRAFTHLDSGQYWNRPITVGRPDQLPSYYGEQYSQFQAIADHTILSHSVTKAWQDWLVVDHEVMGGGEDADINIFIADGVSGYFDAYLPGDGMGGDIVLNRQYYSPNAIMTPTAYHELLSAFGIALGLDGANSPYLGVSVAERVSPDFDIQTPTVNDLLWMQRLYASLSLNGEIGSLEAPEYSSQLDGDYYTFRDSLSGILDHDTLDYSNLVPTLSQPRLTLEGTISFRMPHEEPHQQGELVTIYNGPNMRYRNLIGSADDDIMTGNSLDNTIIGGWGWDLIDGKAGNDLLIGSSGNDRYVFNFQSGHDRIREYNGRKEFSGSDTIIYYHDETVANGRSTLESLFVFQRRGNDLIINLTLDNEGADASITIEKMAWFDYQVESFRMFSGPTVNLANLFGQLADGQTQRFKVDPNAPFNSIGSSVVPAF